MNSVIDMEIYAMNEMLEPMKRMKLLCSMLAWLDEPFANLDYEMISPIVTYLRAQGKTVICTVHDSNLFFCFDHVVRMKDGTASQLVL